MTIDKGHGRVEQREIQVADISKRHFFPHAKQCFMIKRTRTLKGVTSCEVAFGISSIPLRKSSPDLMLGINRGHWSIENSLHYVKDVSFNEDRRHHRKNPAFFASLNNLVISLCRLSGSAFIPTFQRMFRAQPSQALRVLGIVGA